MAFHVANLEVPHDEHGVGVAAADGVPDGESPELRDGSWRQAAVATGHHATHGLRHAVHHLREGQVAPALGRDAARP